MSGRGVSPGHLPILINLCAHAMECMFEALRIIQQNIEHNERFEAWRNRISRNNNRRRRQNPRQNPRRQQ